MGAGYMLDEFRQPELAELDKVASARAAPVNHFLTFLLAPSAHCRMVKAPFDQVSP